ncbi:MAG: phosphoribosylanthranilate isomerase [Pedobacter sp.]|nr:MAG: phosphoribosylanthranilate isomerase [Pedobacter sp.]
MKAKLKICGMKIPENIKRVSDLQPDYMGFIFYSGSKRYVEDLPPAQLLDLPEGVKRVGVFVDETLDEVVRIKENYHLQGLQLHGNETPIYCMSLKSKLSDDTLIIKAFGVDEDFDFASLSSYQGMVDYFLFDTQTPDHGGSGRTFNWQLLEHYTLNVPYFLSGGIGPEQVEELRKIDDDRLYAIDVNSRFETEPGLKDIDKLKDFKARL